jgi:hypothetical protein
MGAEVGAHTTIDAGYWHFQFLVKLEGLIDTGGNAFFAGDA